MNEYLLYSAGSTFWQNGTFEVFKRAGDVTGLSAVDVKVPPELEGSAHVQVSIHMTTCKLNWVMQA